MKVFEGTDKEYYMDGYLVDNLKLLQKAVKNKWDGVIMMDGIEGSAKSTFAASIAYYLDQNYSLDNVVFTQQQFFEAVNTAKKESVIHWDEFVFGGLSTEAMNNMQNALIKKITTIRKKQLYIILCMPWFFMMRPYFAIGRSRCLIHTHTPDGIKRGFFKFYSYKNKNKLYFIGKKEYKYSIKFDFQGRFTDTFGLFWDEDEYDKKKDGAILSLTEGVTKKENKWQTKFMGVMNHMRSLGLSYKRMGEYTGISPQSIHNWMKLQHPIKSDVSNNNLPTNSENGDGTNIPKTGDKIV